jgi:hypothetical protein
MFDSPQSLTLSNGKTVFVKKDIKSRMSGRYIAWEAVSDRPMSNQDASEIMKALGYDPAAYEITMKPISRMVRSINGSHAINWETVASAD